MTRKRTSENELVVSATGAAVPARRKPATRPRAKRAAEPVTPLASPAPEQQTVAPPVDAPVLASVYAPSYDEIAKLAYSYWEARGCQGGCPEEDWGRAENELRNSFVSAAAV
jgi:hypothetical protein